MTVSATIKNSFKKHEVFVHTNDTIQHIKINHKSLGLGSAVNGGELLMLAIATCFCNDIYREAAKRKLDIKSVHVVVSADFENAGEPASNIQYQVKVDSDNTETEISKLIKYVDSIAEIHNTIRKGIPVKLGTTYQAY